MTWWSRLRADLLRPETPVGRAEAPFLIGAATLIIAVTQLSDPASAADLVRLAPALLGFALWPLVGRLPAEGFATLVIASVAFAVAPEGKLEGSYFLLSIMVLYVAWHLGSVVRATIIAAVAAAVPWLIAVGTSLGVEVSWVPWTMANLFTFSAGRSMRRQQELIDQLERAQDALAEQAVMEERRRMARDLHDVAGHTLAAMLLHVTGARHVLRRDLDEAERALQDAETVGRTSLDQIRGVVAALRTHERGTDPALAGTGDLVGLVEEYRRAGLDVAADVEPPVTGIDGPVGAAVYRIAREGLANVARHAAGNAVRLTAGLDGGGVRLVVEDRGRPAAPADPSAGRFGLVGMRERALALGGELEAGPTDHGWRVEARLPVPGPS